MNTPMLDRKDCAFQFAVKDCGEYTFFIALNGEIYQEIPDIGLSLVKQPTKILLIAAYTHACSLLMNHQVHDHSR